MNAARHEPAAGLEQTPARVLEALHDPGFEPEMADLIGHDEIDPLRQLRVRRRRLHVRDAASQPVCPRQLLRQFDDAAIVHAIHVTGPGAARQESQNPRAGRQVEDDVVWTDDLVQRGFKRTQPDIVSQELAVFVENA